MRQREASGQHNAAAKRIDRDIWIVRMPQYQATHNVGQVFPVCTLSSLVQQI